ncbi:protein C3orf33 homolog isoform X1 [Brachyhypopomus gauderio]|uniref:protein C3orf33 homolog isoform X1 n=1 Tax=Brachyhypopomus gauderio TaxID=698409 RepID=UPI0040433644
MTKGIAVSLSGAAYVFGLIPLPCLRGGVSAAALRFINKMPESRNKNAKPEPQPFNFIREASTFVDDNLSLIRNISTVLAVAGVITIARSIKLMTRFGSPSEIPVQFIEKTISIRGKVRRVTERGLEVGHVPVYVPLVSHLLTNLSRVVFLTPCVMDISMKEPQFTHNPHNWQPVSPLDVRLAGVELTPQGHDWLAQRLRVGEIVWLRLIGRQGESLHCLVSVSRGVLFNTCVNEEVLRLGLGRTAPLHGLDPHSRLCWKLHRRLLRSERKAERQGEGLWKEPGRGDRLALAFRDSLVVTMIKKVWKWMWKRRDQ